MIVCVAYLIFVYGISCAADIYQQEPGKLIILNGCPAVGKTTIARKMQEICMSETPQLLWMLHGFDSLFAQPLPSLTPDNPKNYVNGRLIRKGEFLIKNGVSAVALTIGPEGSKAMNGMFAAIEAFLRTGNNVIFDYINYQQSVLKKLTDVISYKSYAVYVVGLKACLEVLEKRESQRDDNYPRGHARAHYDSIDNGFSYDLIVDTEHNDPLACAQKIVSFVCSNKQVFAYKKMSVN